MRIPLKLYNSWGESRFYFWVETNEIANISTYKNGSKKV